MIIVGREIKSVYSWFDWHQNQNLLRNTSNNCFSHVGNYVEQLSLDFWVGKQNKFINRKMALLNFSRYICILRLIFFISPHLLQFEIFRNFNTDMRLEKSSRLGCVLFWNCKNVSSRYFHVFSSYQILLYPSRWRKERFWDWKTRQF